MLTPAPPPSAAPPALWLLVLITFSGTLAMHIFVPALPDAAADLQASSAAIQTTISLYILGLAFGQLVYGPIADGFGRRPTLVAGLLVYTVASVAATLAADLHVLLAARVAQAIGGCSGLLLGRAIVRDTSDIDQTVQRLATLTLLTLIGPGLAPMLGGAITTAFGWRAVFAALAVLGAVTLVLAWRLLPETGRPTGRLSVGSVWTDYKGLLGSPVFVGYAVGSGCATTSMYAFIATAPFIFVQHLQRPVHEVGLYLGIMMVGVSAGNMIARHLVGRVSIETLMVRANALSLASACVLMAMVLLVELRTLPLLVIMVAYAVGAGACSPAASTKTISVDPRVTGSAAGLYGFFQMASGALCTTLAGLGRDIPLSASAVLVGTGVIAQIAFRLALAREAAGRR